VVPLGEVVAELWPLDEGLLLGAELEGLPPCRFPVLPTELLGPEGAAPLVVVLLGVVLAGAALE
jgi:hypothetical protein